MSSTEALWFLVPLPVLIYYWWLRYSPSMSDIYEGQGISRPSIGRSLLAIKAKYFKFFENVTSRLEQRVDNCQEAFYDAAERISSLRELLVKWATGVLLFSILITSSVTAIELIRGDYDVYKTVPDGAICMDGWRSSSQGPGTCSWHGGVDVYLNKEVFSHRHFAEPERYTVLLVAELCGLLVLSFFSLPFRQCSRLFALQAGRYIMLLLLIVTSIPLLLLALPYKIIWNSE